MSNTRNSTNDGDLLPFAHLTEDEIFKKLLDEWCAPMDMEQLQSPILVENIDTDFTFGFENVKPGPSSLDVTANAGLQNQNQNLPAEATRLQAPETTDLKEIDDLKERIRYLEQKVRSFDHYIQQLIPWTVGIAKEFERLTALISSRTR